MTRDDSRERCRRRTVLGAVGGGVASLSALRRGDRVGKSIYRPPTWNRLYGIDDSDQHLNDVVQTHDFGFLLAGRRQPTPDALARSWLLALDDDGALRATRVFAPSGRSVVHRAVAPLGGDRYALFGFTWRVEGESDSDIYVDGDLRVVDGTGTPRRELRYDRGDDDWLYGGATADDAMLAVGETKSFDATGDGFYTEALAVALSPDLDVRWERRFGHTGSNTLRSAVATPDGGWVAVGNVTEDNQREAVAVRYAADGTERWRHRERHPGMNWYADAATAPNGDVVVASRRFEDDQRPVSLTRLSPGGEVVWHNSWAVTIDGAAREWDANAVIRAGDRFLVLGSVALDGGRHGFAVPVSPGGSRASLVRYGPGYFTTAVHTGVRDYLLAGGSVDRGWAVRQPEVRRPTERPDRPTVTTGAPPRRSTTSRRTATSIARPTTDPTRDRTSTSRYPPLTADTVDVTIRNNFVDTSSRGFLATLIEGAKGALEIPGLDSDPAKNEAYINVDIEVTIPAARARGVESVTMTLRTNGVEWGENQQADGMERADDTTFRYDNFRVQTRTQVGLTAFKGLLMGLSLGGTRTAELGTAVQARTESYPDVTLDRLNVHFEDGQVEHVPVDRTLPRYSDICPGVADANPLQYPRPDCNFGGDAGDDYFTVSGWTTLSPASVRVADAAGRVTGWAPTDGDGVRDQIPDAFYSGPLRHEFVFLRGEGDYAATVEGTGTGTATLLTERARAGSGGDDPVVESRIYRNVSVDGSTTFEQDGFDADLVRVEGDGAVETIPPDDRVSLSPAQHLARSFGPADGSAPLSPPGGGGPLGSAGEWAIPGVLAALGVGAAARWYRSRGGDG